MKVRALTDVDKIYERKKHLFPVEAEKGCKKGELRLRKVENELQIVFYRTDEDWEDLSEWYDSRIEGETVVLVNEEDENPVFVNDESVEVKSDKSQKDGETG